MIADLWQDHWKLVAIPLYQPWPYACLMQVNYRTLRMLLFETVLYRLARQYEQWPRSAYQSKPYPRQRVLPARCAHSMNSG
jgi:hypothetical protein